MALGKVKRPAYVGGRNFKTAIEGLPKNRRFTMNISNRIKLLRTEFEYTQKTLSDKIGLTPKMISFYENGECIPPINIVLKFVEIFDVSADYLLGLSDKRPPDACISLAKCCDEVLINELIKRGFKVEKESEYGKTSDKSRR